ncbi:phage/plasmid primase, P4 family [Blastococcus sp. TBT05-19]|uniref:DNA primase family protein n=1 Tax=Blastococcus sp. TBT05-19 TaxID=2250581 RepID=UPI001314C735|nr:phage/plasmid primase, P4 family [Blastococcus sp. TBT05-19]
MPATAPVDWLTADADSDLSRARLSLQHIRSLGYGLAFAHSAPRGGWLLGSPDGVWSPVHVEQVVPFIHAVGDKLTDAADQLWQRARDEGDSDASRVLQARANRLMTSARAMRRARSIADIITTLKSLPGVAAEWTAFDSDPDVLLVANGVIDLRTGNLRPASLRDRLTRRVDVAYRPEATAPTWERFLDEALVDEDGETDRDVVDFMRRLTGYGITGHTREQCFAVLFGKGGNGKGVFTETLKSILTAHTVATPFSTFEQQRPGSIPNDIAALKGARLVLASEGEVGAPMAEATIKRVTGQDTISARFMRAEYFEFKPSFLIILSTNYKPNFKGQDEGLWRRVKLVPFRRYVEPDKRDGRLGEKLLAEAEGILAWAVRGAIEWYADGLQEPETLKAGTSAYREESDRLGEFLADRVEITGERLDVVTLTDLWKSYEDWADEVGEDRKFSRRLFTTAIGERAGITPDRRSNRPIYRNVRILPVAERLRRAHLEATAEAAGRGLALTS